MTKTPSAELPREVGHTPGPWLVDPITAHIAVPDRDAPICALLWPTDLRSEAETFANARLIAAAPDLLAVLKDLERNGHTEATWARGLAAIAKAEGRS